jgi:hypothetical protein
MLVILAPLLLLTTKLSRGPTLDFLISSLQYYKYIQWFKLIPKDLYAVILFSYLSLEQKSNVAPFILIKPDLDQLNLKYKNCNQRSWC